jgi:epoxyqueuosine reductase
MSSPALLADRALILARQAGFDHAGIASAEAPQTLAFLREWTERGYAGTMSYITEQLSRRISLRAAFPWSRSVLVGAVAYDTDGPYSTATDPGRGWIARYAWGDDYHDVVRARLEALRSALTSELGAFESCAYVDTGPISEKAYAAAAGVGAYGKNTCLLNPTLGSWFFLGVLVTDIDLAPGTPAPDLCGSCRACLDACPTEAFPEPYVLDATRCISYLTIETKGAIDPSLRKGMGRQVFGCDICQDVCPWNRRRRVKGEPRFAARDGALAPSLIELAQLSEGEFKTRFRKSPVKRAKRSGLLRNVAVALGNVGDPRARETREALHTLATGSDVVVTEHAEWGLRRLAERGGV